MHSIHQIPGSSVDTMYHFDMCILHRPYDRLMQTKVVLGADIVRDGKFGCNTSKRQGMGELCCCRTQASSEKPFSAGNVLLVELIRSWGV